MKTGLRAASVAAIMVGLAYAQPALATGEIVAPTSGVINSGGPGDGSINDTLNQNGLNSGYTSGVTNFNTYIGTNPTHSYVFFGNEWFSNNGTNSASVTYDMGSLMGLDALALWNEESSGIGTLALFGSTDGILFDPLGVFSPTDNTANPLTDYGADVFTFTPTLLQFIRFDMSNCPQADGTYPACAIGEVAFRTADVTTGVPEPSTWAMMLLGFGAMGFVLRRSRKRTMAAQFA